ncbi:hypothetical protein [Inquilinus sp. CA228]|uniref:hypothetical protein n=1 Tax=Inquilinus sp. CA228 TaxID=3455609 RepID=UPI003F8D0D51
MATYAYETKVVIHPWTELIHGGFIFQEPVVVVDASDCESIGRTIMGASALSLTGSSHPTDWKSLTAPLLKATASKSWRQFAQKSKYVHIATTAGRLTLEPHLRAQDGSFALLPSAAFEGASDSNRLVAAALNKAFALCV